MAKQKEKKVKETLITAAITNKKAPVWVYLKTKNRDLIRSRKRNWRHEKLKLKTPHKKHIIRANKHRNPAMCNPTKNIKK